MFERWFGCFREQYFFRKVTSPTLFFFFFFFFNIFGEYVGFFFFFETIEVIAFSFFCFYPKAMLVINLCFSFKPSTGRLGCWNVKCRGHLPIYFCVATLVAGRSSWNDEYLSVLCRENCCSGRATEYINVFYSECEHGNQSCSRWLFLVMCIIQGKTKRLVYHMQNI